MSHLLMYLTVAENLKVDPLFWCSQVYLSQFPEVRIDGWVFPWDEPWAILEPLPYIKNAGPCPDVPVWARSRFRIGQEFLDYNYIYDATKVAQGATAAGKKWRTFRKNVRKWPRTHPNHVYTPLHTEERKKAHPLVRSWITSKGDSLQDGEALLHCLEHGHAAALWYKGSIVALNIWDVNWKYVNFRFNICLEGEPFLSEYSRWLFYNAFARSRTIINDGGVLDNAGLKAFKDRLQPIAVREVYSDAQPEKTDESNGLLENSDDGSTGSVQ